METEFAELEKLAGEQELPREVLQAMSHLARRSGTLGLSEPQLHERLNHLQELHILLTQCRTTELTTCIKSAGSISTATSS